MTTFTGTSGNDFLPGYGKNNSGNDIFIGGAGNDSVVAMANNMYIGFSQFGGTYSVETVSANNHYGVHIKAPTAGATLDFSGTTLTGIDHIEGSAATDVITGSPGSDTILTLDGNDFIDESGGTDSVDGGNGTDIYLFGQNTSGKYAAQQSAGNASVWTLTNTGTTGPSGYTVTLNSDGTRLVTCTNSASASLKNVEKLDFYGGDFGSNGDDRLAGSTRADTFVGLAGNDTYVVDNPGDVVVENPGEGTDTVQATISSYTLGSNVENLTFPARAASLARATISPTPSREARARTC